MSNQQFVHAQPACGHCDAQQVVLVHLRTDYFQQ